jgi:hypothetical protein
MNCFAQLEFCSVFNEIVNAIDFLNAHLAGAVKNLPHR